jgi:hypothetical protein
MPATRAHSPIVRILAPQAADTPRKGSIYVLSTPDDLALSDFGLLQDCQLMTATMVPTPRAHSPIVLMLAPQAADTPRKGSIYVLSTPDDLALRDFGLLQDCPLMTAIMVQFLEVKHSSKKIIFPNFLILTERLDPCYARLYVKDRPSIAVLSGIDSKNPNLIN